MSTWKLFEATTSSLIYLPILRNIDVKNYDVIYSKVYIFMAIASFLQSSEFMITSNIVTETQGKDPRKQNISHAEYFPHLDQVLKTSAWEWLMSREDIIKPQAFEGLFDMLKNQKMQRQTSELMCFFIWSLNFGPDQLWLTVELLDFMV